MIFSRSNSAATKKNGSIALVAIIACMLCFGCKSQYRHLEPGTADINCLKTFRPHFTTTLYSAIIDVTKYHFSGMLYFKRMPDSTTRVVFTNEMGVKFFDFGFTDWGGFEKYYILPKLDKRAVVKALRNDLSLVLLNRKMNGVKSLRDSSLNYLAVPYMSHYDYYITNADCSKLIRIEKASRRKPVVVAEMLDYQNNVPNIINIRHKNFKFSIALKRVEKE